MPVEQANEFLSSKASMLNAFDVPIQRHFRLGNTAEEIRQGDWMRAAQATSDFFTTGVAFHANRGPDSYLQEIGTTAWWTVNQKRAIVALTDNVLAAAVQLGLPLNTAVKQYSIKDEPHVLFMGKQEGKQVTEIGYVLLPPEAVIRMKTNPIEGLATTAYICSQLRDLANGRLTVDQKMINPRAWATESHFLKLALKHHPNVKLSEVFLGVLDRYPNGLDDLPSGARYRGISGTEFMSSSIN